MVQRPDFHCPFCNNAHAIYEPLGEDEATEVECTYCERNFEVVAVVNVTYKARCLDADHRFELDDKFPAVKFCEICGTCKPRSC